MIVKESLEKELNSLKEMCEYYTNQVTTCQDYMKSYYQGKLDGLTMGVIALNYVLKQEDKLVNDMLNKMEEDEIAKSCLVSDIYNPYCNCEMCGRKR